MLIKRIVATLTLTALTSLALAESQFYFVTQAAPAGSLTAPGQDEQAVYLRWDAVDTELPEEIVSFSLYRDGDLIKTFPAHDTMSADQIRPLYQGESEQRRLLETVTQLKEEALRTDDLPDFNTDQYADIIAARLDDDFWAHLASRMDFNLAVARHRAWRDTEPESGVVSYELRALNAEGQSRRVGLAQVDMDQPQQILAPELFAQIEQSTCGMPDYRDHYSVALNWAMPGGINQADLMANQLFVTGYDLYRTVENVTSAPARDLAAEAAKLPHDNQGRVQFDDLERVNDTQLTITPDDDPQVPEWLETRDDLLAAGLVPGDTRAYYLVPRDVAGQYGPTVETLVTVADMSRPPAPWDVSPYLNEAAQQVELVFDAMDIERYQAAFGRDRTFCNLDTAAEDGFLDYVRQDESCATDTPRRVQTNIEEYLVYRFENYAQASAFKDSDGDGIPDAVERPLGTECTPQEPFGGFRMPIQEERQPLSEGEKVILIDDEPAEFKGDVYWYRLASRSETGRLSLLSEPVRVNFPDRTLPDPPDVSVTQPGTEICDCEIETATGGKEWRFEDMVALSTPPELQCGGSTTSYTLSPDAISSGGNLCQDTTFIDQCGSQYNRTFTFEQDNGDTFSCSLPGRSTSLDMCALGTMRVKPVQCEGQVEAPEGVVSGPLTIRAEPVDLNHCVTLSQQIMGDQITLGTSCGAEDPVLEYEHTFGEFCGFAVSQDGNNNVSATTQIGCRSVPADSDWTLAPALPIELTPLADQMDLQWRMPSQVQAVVELELTRTEPTGQDPIRTTVPAIDLSRGGEQQTRLDIPPLGTEDEEWCMRLRTFAPSSQVGEPHYSNWSAPLCTARTETPTAPPEWLPWPQLAEIPEGEPLTVQQSADVETVSSQIPVSNGLYIPLGELFYNTGDCDTNAYTRGVIGSVDATPPENGLYLAQLNCTTSGYGKAQSLAGAHLDMMVFRQARSPQGNTSEYVQVSPLMDYVHWEPVYDLKETGVIAQRLHDPFIWAIADADYFNRIELVFFDRAGLLESYDYRYQVVYFDDEKRLRQWRATEWTPFESGDALMGED